MARARSLLTAFSSCEPRWVSEACEDCVCDLNASAGATASDALFCMKAAVGLSVTLACPVCASHTIKDDLIDDLPVLVVDPATPAGSSMATVTVDAPGAVSIDLAAVGDGCGDFPLLTQVSGATLTLGHLVAAFGECELTASVNDGATVETFITRFSVTPSSLLLPALEVVGGVFLEGPLPDPTGGADDPNIAGIVAPPSLINGGTAEVRVALVDPTQAANISQVLVEVSGAAGFAGHWAVPAEVVGDEIVFQVGLDSEFAAPTSVADAERFLTQTQLQLGATDILVQLVDLLGNVGDQLLQAFGVTTVGSGDVQVSLSWDTATDVDLHVIEPSGEEIYWDHPSSSGGGSLDLDSNAGCSIDNINNENVNYGSGAPVGEYIVRVDYWSDCGGLPANYTVTVRNCGQVSTFTGSFAGGASDEGDAGSGVEITRFVSSCSARVRGKATYEDFAQTNAGLATASTMLPIRFAQVEVRRASDDAVLATGDTKQDGSFDIRFVNDGTAGYYVLVKAKQSNKILKQLVKNNAGQIYSVRSTGTINEVDVPDKTGLKIEAKLASNGPAPAFNVFDVGVVGATLIKRSIGKTPSQLDWLWTSGQHGACRGKVSCYNRRTKLISVLSIAADRDEYDDLVLLHEYGHFFQNNYSRSDSPGGSHSSSNRIDTRLAWGEGSATFFGNQAKGTALYLDTAAKAGGGTRVAVRSNLESPSVRVPAGTDNGTQTGKLSEITVAAVMWDLADKSNESKDTLSNEKGVFSALLYLKSASFANRGNAGADLVDFLDGWFCKGHNNRGDANKGVQGSVVGLHSFNYDFAAVPSCK